MAKLKYYNTTTNSWENISVSGKDGYTPIKGVDYFDGKDGKSAYVYAKEAGYIGTEEEFALKLMEKSPKALEMIIFDNSDGTGTSDKTYEEILAAYENGSAIFGRIELENQSAVALSPMTYATDINMFIASGVDGSGLYWGVAVGNEGIMLGNFPLVHSPVIGTTTEITPSLVKELMDEGKPFAITHIDSNYGPMLFNSFVYSAAANNSIMSSTTFYIPDVTMCAVLNGDLDNDTWNFYALQVATEDKLPKAFYITVTKNGTEYVADKTIEEIEAAYLLGKPLYCYHTSSFDNITYCMPLRARLGNGTIFAFNNTSLQGMGIVLILSSGVQVTESEIVQYDDIPEPDWNAPEGEPGHVLNRTHWIETINPVFNGDLTGKEYIKFSNSENYIVKVSSQYVDVDMLNGATIIMNEKGADVEIALTSPHKITSDLTNIVGANITGAAVLLEGVVPAILSIPDNFSSNGITITKGTWFIYSPGGGYIKSLSCLSSEEIHKLDNKFIDAEWMATNAFTKDFTYVEYLSAPFVKFSDSHNYLTTISDINESMYDLTHGNNYLIIWDGKEYILPCKGDEGTHWKVFGNLSIVDSSAENTGEPFLIQIYADSNYTMDNLFWGFCKSVNPIHSIGIYDYTYKDNKLPAKFLPDYLPKIETIVGETLISQICQTESLASYGGAFGINLPFANKLTSIPEKLTIILDGIEYKDLAVITTPLGCITGNLSKVNALQGTSFEDTGEPFMLGIDEYGCLLATNMTQSTTHYITVKISDVEVIHKLDSKFIDAEWMATSNAINGKAIVEEESFKFYADSTTNDHMYSWFDPNFTIENEKEYFVIIDGVKYKARYIISEENDKIKAMGNLTEIDPLKYADTANLPFLFTLNKNDSPDGNFAVIILHGTSQLENLNHTIGIYEVFETPNKLPEKYLPESVDSVIIRSSTEGSTKKFRLTIDDSGTISVSEVT